MIVNCYVCRHDFEAQFSAPNNYSVRCPYCGTVSVVNLNNLNPGPASAVMGQYPRQTPAYKVAQRVRRTSIVCNILWLIIGAMQIASACSTWALVGFDVTYALTATAAVGVWNIVNAFLDLRNAKNIQPGNPNVVSSFESQKNSLIATALANLVLGGAIGVILIAVDWFNRRYVLSHRYAFEQPMM